MELLQTRELQNFPQIPNHLSQPLVIGQQNDGFMYSEIRLVIIVDTLSLRGFLQALMQSR